MEKYLYYEWSSFFGVAEFAATARSNNRTKFIGEECGGGYYGNSSGDEAMVTLPNTHIKYMHSFNKIYDGSKKRAG